MPEQDLVYVYAMPKDACLTKTTSLPAEIHIDFAANKWWPEGEAPKEIGKEIRNFEGMLFGIFDQANLEHRRTLEDLDAWLMAGRTY